MAGAGTEVGTRCRQGIPEEGETVLPRKVRVVYREKGTPRLAMKAEGSLASGGTVCVKSMQSRERMGLGNGKNSEWTVWGLEIGGQGRGGWSRSAQSALGIQTLFR